MVSELSQGVIHCDNFTFLLMLISLIGSIMIQPQNVQNFASNLSLIVISELSIISVVFVDRKKFSTICFSITIRTKAFTKFHQLTEKKMIPIRTYALEAPSVI